MWITLQPFEVGAFAYGKSFFRVAVLPYATQVSTDESRGLIEIIVTCRLSGITALSHPARLKSIPTYVLP